MRRRKPLTYAAALAAANKETSFILMDLATQAPGGVQAPTPGDTSFIAALRARRSNTNTNTNGANATEKRRCFYCDGEGHIREGCPTPLKDYLHQQTRMGNRRQSPLTLGKACHQLPRSTTAGPKKVKFAEAANTLPTVAESYGRRQVATLEGDTDSPGAVDDSWGDVDLTTYDEATVAAL